MWEMKSSKKLLEASNGFLNSSTHLCIFSASVPHFTKKFTLDPTHQLAPPKRKYSFGALNYNTDFGTNVASLQWQKQIRRNGNFIPFFTRHTIHTHTHTKKLISLFCIHNNYKLFNSWLLEHFLNAITSIHPYSSEPSTNVNTSRVTERANN